MTVGEPSKVIIPIFGILDVTGEVICEWILIAVIALLSFAVTHRLKERPGRLQNMAEAGVEYLVHFFTDTLGAKNARKYFFFLGSMFVFIIFANYCGMIPGVGMTDFVKAPTSSLSVTAGLGICAFLFLQIAGLANGPKKYLKHFISPIAVMLPLLLMDELIKPVSLALRLFGNVYGEESVTEKLYEILPIGAPVVMMALSILFCALQAVVFTMLTSIYLAEMIED